MITKPQFTIVNNLVVSCTHTYEHTTMIEIRINKKMSFTFSEPVFNLSFKLILSFSHSLVFGTSDPHRQEGGTQLFLCQQSMCLCVSIFPN